MNTLYFVVLFFIALAAAIEWPDPFKVMRATCANQTGITEEQLLLRSHDHIDSMLGPYIICLADQLNALNKTALLHEDVAVHTLSHAIPDAMARWAIRCCGDLALRSDAETQVERFVIFARCFRSKIPTVLYDLIGIWGKPSFHHSDTCDLK